jgi:hypothetical protein
MGAEHRACAAGSGNKAATPPPPHCPHSPTQWRRPVQRPQPLAPATRKGAIVPAAIGAGRGGVTAEVAAMVRRAASHASPPPPAPPSPGRDGRRLRASALCAGWWGAQAWRLHPCDWNWCWCLAGAGDERGRSSCSTTCRARPHRTRAWTSPGSPPSQNPPIASRLTSDPQCCTVTHTHHIRAPLPSHPIARLRPSIPRPATPSPHCAAPAPPAAPQPPPPSSLPIALSRLRPTTPPYGLGSDLEWTRIRIGMDPDQTWTGLGADLEWTSS